MHDRKNLHTVVHFLINNLIRKANDPHASDWFIQKLKPIRPPGDGLLCDAKSVEKIPRQLRPGAGVAFCGGSKFNIGFTV